MNEVIGDLFDYADQGEWIVITTNGAVRRDGACVMGRGVAQVAAIRWSRLPYALGERLTRAGNHVYAFHDFKVFTFPVKEHWREQASLRLIRQSTTELVQQVDALQLQQVFMVRPGCGNGGLRWVAVRRLLENRLDARFIVVELPERITNK